MANPYRVLGVAPASDDETIRRSYHALIRRFPPERAPEEFRCIQASYEAVRDLRARLQLLLFQPSQGESLEEWTAEVRLEGATARMSLDQVRKLYGLSTEPQGPRQYDAE